MQASPQLVFRSDRWCNSARPRRLVSTDRSIVDGDADDNRHPVQSVAIPLRRAADPSRTPRRGTEPPSRWIERDALDQEGEGLVCAIV